MKRGFTLIELLVVIAIIAILASILFPVFAKARSKARQATCTSQVRQIVTAVMMYNQDGGGQYPGVDGSSWVSKLAPYLGNSDKMFMCPEDTSGNSGKVSYALAGILIRADGTGIKEGNVLSPTEVGCVCDASPSETYPSARLVGGGALSDPTIIEAVPAARHSKGTVVGFCDGHVQYLPPEISMYGTSVGKWSRMFDRVLSLGLIDNPLGCVGNSSGAPTALGGSVGSSTGDLVVGGEYATRALVMAAAGMYAGGSVFSRGFNGQNATAGRPSDGSYAWGTASGVAGSAAGLPTTAMAYDAVCVIVAKGSKIPSGGIASGVNGLGSYTNDTYIVNTATINTLFGMGYQAGTVQVYQLGPNFSTTAAIKSAIGMTGNFGTDTLTVVNDLEMVDKVSNDPYAIGYCSTVFADPDRVTILGLAGMGTDGKDAIWPNSSTKFRWAIPTMAESTWPWKRALNVSCNAGGTGAYIANNLINSNFMNNGLKLGPLFKGGYWPGNP